MKYNEKRRKTRPVRVGALTVGGSAPLAVQSMTNTDPHDYEATLAQIRSLRAAGCDIVRITVPDKEAADVLYRLKLADVGMPIVADIHFDYRVALLSVERGADKIRINPGNIGEDSRVKAVTEACRAHGVPIRIGVNGGSLEKHILQKFGAPTAEALCESAFYHIHLLEKYDFYDTVISIKSSDVATMIAANRLLASRCDYPIHIGVTEAGGMEQGRIKSAIGIGALLSDGIGDTFRVSLTADPIEEIAAARDILSALHIEGQSGLDVVSCPTCGRTRIDLIGLEKRFRAAVNENGLASMPVKVALMGCAVNGPGEAGEADIGICGGDGCALLMKHGEIVEKIGEDEIIPRLIAELKNMNR